MKKNARKIYLNIVICVIVIALFIVVVSLLDKSEPVSIMVLPTVPREDLPILITFSLNNPSGEDDIVNYEFYANGELLMQGKAHLLPSSTGLYTYVYPDAPKIGERVTFMVKTESGRGTYKKMFSMPAYPPQVWSSFVSFASFSTTLMSSTMSSTMGSSMSSSMGAVITSENYYSSSFGNNHMNVGVVFSITLILLLVYLELTEPLKERTFTMISGLRLRFSRLTMILLIVFSGMVFSRMALVV